MSSKLREMRSLHAKVSSYFMVDQNRPVEISSLVLADPTGKSWLDYGVLIDDPKLGVRDGTQLKVNISLPPHHRSRRNDSRRRRRARVAGFHRLPPMTPNSRRSSWPAGFPSSPALTNWD